MRIKMESVSRLHVIFVLVLFSFYSVHGQQQSNGGVVEEYIKSEIKRQLELMKEDVIKAEVEKQLDEKLKLNGITTGNCYIVTSYTVTL